MDNMTGSRFQMKEAPKPPQVKIDLNLAANLLCKCGNATFTEVVVFKIISPILDPNGKGGLAPVPLFACNSCGAVPDQIMEKVGLNPMTQGESNAQ